MTTTLEDINIEEIRVEGYERVVKCVDSKSNLTAIVAIHDTTLGPALGGTRIYPYASEDDALFDVLRLSKGMTYKSALAGLGLGGGKSVIIADPKKDKTPELFHSFGRLIESLAGAYICAEDSGCTHDDMAIIHSETRYVVGLEKAKGSGNPAPFTAWGVFRGIQATAQALFGSDSLEGKKVAVQGLGAVGMLLIEHLFWHGAELIVADMDAAKIATAVQKFGATVVAPDEILSVECDILAPCALGGIINSTTIPNLRCAAVAGAANNQLLNEQDSQLLHERDILYAPDFVINAGGVINAEFDVNPSGYLPIEARRKVDNVYSVLESIYNIAKHNKTTTLKAAVSLAEHRIQYGIGKRQVPVVFHT